MPLESIVAIEGALTVQVTPELRSAVEPSLYFALAVNCWLAPVEMLALPGETEIDDIVLVGVVEPEPGTPEHPILAASVAKDTNARTGKSKNSRVGDMNLLPKLSQNFRATS